MNCIEAIEGTVKSVLTRFHQVSVADRLDDTEQIKNVKVVLEAAALFLKENEESLGDSKMLEQVLYNFAKDLWLKKSAENPESEPVSETEPAPSEEDNEYHEYYYDYIYHNGVYPP